LVLAMYLNDRIRVRTPSGDVIWVQLVQLETAQAKLGFEAADDVEVMRERLLAPAERYPAGAGKGA
jgi:sRNA-binding carbon storage regulator CsrA